MVWWRWRVSCAQIQWAGLGLFTQDWLRMFVWWVLGAAEIRSAGKAQSIMKHTACNLEPVFDAEA